MFQKTTTGLRSLRWDLRPLAVPWSTRLTRQTVNISHVVEIYHHSAMHSSTWLKLTTCVKCFARSQPSIHQGLRLSCPTKTGWQQCIVGRPSPIVISLLTRSKDKVITCGQQKTQKLVSNYFWQQPPLRSHQKLWNMVFKTHQSNKVVCHSILS